jgi:hypothetical protein
MDCYIPVVSALDFDCSTLDEAQIFLIAGAVVRDRWFSDRCQEIEAADNALREMRSELSMPIIISRMSQDERSALRQRVISANRWLAEKLAPRKTKRGPAVTAF